ncbi:MAG: hypothetical protein K0S10_481, partial [Rubrobacteraceae bacterium]|nr:hypothetical protein [Rubrobacteraceae bacterium]
SQFHPEFKSRPVRPHPLFYGFVGACASARKGHDVPEPVTRAEEQAAS